MKVKYWQSASAFSFLTMHFSICLRWMSFWKPKLHFFSTVHFAHQIVLPCLSLNSASQLINSSVSHFELRVLHCLSFLTVKKKFCIERPVVRTLWGKRSFYCRNESVWESFQFLHLWALKVFIYQSVAFQSRKILWYRPTTAHIALTYVVLSSFQLLLW
jgi:predicted membrane protein